jgi:tRNA wybutosine-synthesizing protein 3
MNFQQQKQNLLNKIDKSQKKSIDKGIIPLVNKINKKPNYYTTSSCSGRIIILARKSHKKQDTKWHFSTHSTTTFKQVKDSLNSIPKQELWFRQEPLILHVCCKALEDAKKLLNTARDVFKRSGIITLNKRIVLEIIGSDALYTLIARNGKLLINDSYLKDLVKEANKKMKNNKKKITKFYNFFL